MKTKKVSVFRLELEKDTCACRIYREYSDARYTTPLGEPIFTACDKHAANSDIAEFAKDTMVECLAAEAQNSGKTAVVLRESTPTSLSGTTGESVTSMGAPIMPRTREKRDPLAPKNARFERPSARKPSNTEYGNPNIAEQDDISPEELEAAGITMNGSIDEVAEDPRVDAALNTGLHQLEGVFDAEDVKTGGVSQALIDRYAVD